MMMRVIRAAVAVLALAVSVDVVSAASIRVAPISVRAPAGGNTASVRLWNDDRKPIAVQVRIFKWSVKNGKDVLEPTKNVVVSPPMTTLVPGTANVIRIVRVAKEAPVRKESYRLIVDQLPDRTTSKAGTVSIMVRHAIPVYFE